MGLYYCPLHPMKQLYDFSIYNHNRNTYKGTSSYTIKVGKTPQKNYEWKIIHTQSHNDMTCKNT